MRRHPLAPPRLLPAGLDWPARRHVEAPPVADDPARDKLPPPLPASSKRRPLFHPRRGWFRRLQRRVSNALGQSFYPRVPGIRIPYGRQLRRRLTLSEADLALDALPTAFDGTRVLLISDVHAGPFVSRGVLRETFARLLRLEPDLILLAGDLTTSRLVEFVEQRHAFGMLHAPLGVFAVLGNHDHYTRQPARLRRLIERVGIEVLHNRPVELRRGAERLWLAGVDDLLVGRVDLDAALRGTEPPVILLSHNPDLFHEAAGRGVALTLSGHTHGGQIRIPGLPVLARQSRYRLDEGRYRAGRSEIVVSRGLGAVGLPFRMACPPEAVLLTLRRSRA